MTLGWKDLVTTLLAGITGWYYFVTVGGNTGYRMPVLVLGLIGMTMCAFSGGTTPANGAFVAVASTLGVLALILVVYGLITGAKIAFVLLAGTILLLWLAATFRHAIGA